MTPRPYTEDTLVQQTTAEYLEKELGWESVFAYNNEGLGPESLLGRESEREIVLVRYLREKLKEFNPGLPEEAYEAAIREIVTASPNADIIGINREKYDLIRNGVKVPYRDSDGNLQRETLKVIDFDNPEANRFLCVRELWLRGDIYRKRADIIGFVNGLPLMFMECKNIHRNLRVAYNENYSDYKDTVPHIFQHNAFVVFGNGDEARIGSITSKWDHFHEWKRLEEEEPGAVDMETLLKGICNKSNFIDLLENFIVFDESGGHPVKIIARNHQFLGVNKAVESVRNRKELEGKLGVFWHTQGSGKSYSMVFFTRKVHQKLGGDYTFLMLTDRDDLDTQLYKTFAGCGVVNNDKEPCRAASGKNLKELLSEQKKYVFSLIQKFNQEVKEVSGYSDRDNFIVITDEAHRTQYGTLALNMRDALPNASFIGFTGTPLFKEDEITRQVFGEYVSTYDFQRAVEDRATVPLYYDARGDKLGLAVGDLNEQIAGKLEELEVDDIDVQLKLERELQRDYHIMTADTRLEAIAADFVDHYSTAWENGKAMLVCIDKITCVRMYNLIEKQWAIRIAELEKDLKNEKDEQEIPYRERQIAWMKETVQAVVISEEQGEVEKFRKWNLDILPHRKLIKDGIGLPDTLKQDPIYRNMLRMDLDEAFKEERHPFRIAIVCAMWLTGFDVPSLSTLYLDKPLKAHTLMQAIARANRVHEGKTNGLIVDYCGILKQLRDALSEYAGGSGGGGGGGAGPATPEAQLLLQLGKAITQVKEFLKERNAPLEHVQNREGFQRNAAIRACKEAVNENDRSRRKFGIMCRQVFKLFRACINQKAGIKKLRPDRDAINIVYKSLYGDTEEADISDIIMQLHAIVNDAIEVKQTDVQEDGNVYDISKIDFEKLKQEFAKKENKRSLIYDLRKRTEQQLKKMMERNPLRTDFQKKYEKMIEQYNSEKDRQSIEESFQKLLNFIAELDQEDSRAVREGLDDESLAIYDLLRKDTLNPAEIKKIKDVSHSLLESLKKEKLKIDHWRDKEATRDAVKQTIHDYLYDSSTGLPEDSYTEKDVEKLSEAVFVHVFRVYPRLPSPVYG